MTERRSRLAVRQEEGQGEGEFSAHDGSWVSRVNPVPSVVNLSSSSPARPVVSFVCFRKIGRSLAIHFRVFRVFRGSQTRKPVRLHPFILP